MIGQGQFEFLFGNVPPGDTERLRQVIRAAVRGGLAVVMLKPGGKTPLCPLTDRQRVKADREAREAAESAGDDRWAAVRHPCGIAHALTEWTPAADTAVKRVLAAGVPNIGISLAPSRLVVVDVDTPTEREAFLADWSSETGTDESGRSMTVLSPGAKKGEEWMHHGGGHWWFTLPEDVKLPAGSGAVKTESGWTVYYAERQILVPPSVRSEGPYRLVGQVEECPRWLVARIEMDALGRAERITRNRGAVLTATDIDQMNAGIPWGDLLLPDGWAATGLVDTCGCPIWTAPGPHDSPKSATAHDLGCTRYNTDTGHGPLHVWTNNPPEWMSAGGNTFTKLQYLAWRDHGGDNGAALVALGINEHRDTPVVHEYLPETVQEQPRESGADPFDCAGDPEPEHEPPEENPKPSNTCGVCDRLLAVKNDPITRKVTRYCPWCELVAKKILDKKANKEADKRISAEEASSLPDPKSTGLADLLAEPDDGPIFLIDNLWPAGGNIVLAAQRKAGKTTLTGNVVRCLADDAVFLGETTDPFDSSGVITFGVDALSDGETVMIVDLELDRRTLRRWLRDQGIRNLDKVRAESFRGRVGEFDVMDDHRRALWVDHLKANNVKVLVIDPLAPLLSAYGYEENDNSGVTNVLAALDMLKAEAGISEMLVVHHMGHNGERSRGAARLRDWPDAEWRLVREEGEDGKEPPPDCARFFIADGRDVAVPETRLAYDRSSRRLSVAGGNRVQHAATKHEPAVLKVIGDRPGLTVRGVQDTAVRLQGVTRDGARDSLSALVAAGRVHTYPGPRNARHHALDDGCGTPSECPTARPVESQEGVLTP